jgi:hypothetical protein
VRRDGPDHGPGDAVEGPRSKARPKGIPLRRRRGIRLMESGSGVIFLLLRLRLVKQAQQLSSSAFYVRKGWQRVPITGLECHSLKLLRFQLSVENHWSPG